MHHDGLIWLRALWDIRNALGNATADTIILEAQLGMRDPTMPQLAANTVDVAEDLYGPAVAAKVRGAFEDRGIL